MSTGIVFDQIFLKHDQPGHPEHSGRLRAIIDELESSGFWNKFVHLKTRMASKQELRLCHTEEYINNVKTFCENGGGYLDADTYSNKYSYTAAATAVGSSLNLTSSIIKGELKNGFALLRPPGHHALANRAMGFCLFGNIAIAAKNALTKPGVRKVAIVDFDVHHGNGTQALVGEEPNILFISTHQYPFYPGTGRITEIGTGDAEGTIVNIPFQAGVGDEGFKIVYENIVIPAVERFQPDLILVSAGYDAHRDDPLANMNLTLAGFDWITGKLIRTAEKVSSGKIIFFLEGGYNLKALRLGVANTLRSLLGLENYPDISGNNISNEPDVTKPIEELKRIHQL